MTYMMDNFNLIDSLLAMFLAGALLYWATSSLVRNFKDRKRWNYGRCTKCNRGEYRRLESASKREYGGLWYQCNKCSYAIFLKYYDPEKDVCW